MKYSEFSNLVGIHADVIRFVENLGFEARMKFDNGDLSTNIHSAVIFQVLRNQPETFTLRSSNPRCFVIGCYGDFEDCKRAIVKVLECLSHRENDFEYNIEAITHEDGSFAGYECDERINGLAARILTEIKQERSEAEERYYSEQVDKFFE